MPEEIEHARQRLETSVFDGFWDTNYTAFGCFEGPQEDSFGTPLYHHSSKVSESNVRGWRFRFLKAFGARNCILFACFESASGRGLWNWTVTSLMKKRMEHVSGKILFGRAFSSDFFW